MQLSREQALSRLKLLRDLDKEEMANSGAQTGFRFYFDTIVGGYKFGGLPTNYRATAKNVFRAIPRSKGVQALEQSGLSRGEIASRVILEHKVPLIELRELVRRGEFDLAIDLHSVCFVTKEEDAILRKAESSGITGSERYRMLEMA
jgi:hypothetical protein